MSDRVPPIARIRLSRSLPRLLGLPALGMVAGVAATAAGLLAVPGIVGWVVAGLGAAAALAALLGAITLLGIRLDVEEAAVRVHWLGGERLHALSPGPVTRVRFRGENASRLRARKPVPWQLGRATLRDEEEIQVVRLAPTATAILVPTEDGRLAIAAADEDALLDALSRAARARQRLEELTREPPPEPAPEPAPALSLETAEIDPALMTGIERALHERRLAAEREAAAEIAAVETPSPPEAVTPAEQVAPPARRGRLRLARPRLGPTTGPSLALLVLPLIGAGVAWASAVLLDRMPDPTTDLGRLTALALVLAGPATTVGAIMARVWWPRLVAVVVAGGLASAVFVGRALLG